MSSDKVTVTDQGLLNINRKIINDRKFAQNLITNIGNVSIDSNTASEFGPNSYLQKTDLTFTGEPITIIFEGNFVTPVEGSTETAWVLSGTGGSIKFQIVHETINEGNSTYNINYPRLVLPSGASMNFADQLNFIDGSHFKAFVEVSPEFCKVYIEFEDEIISSPKFIYTNPLDLTTFSTITLGNDPSLGYFWEGSINLKEFEIRENNSTLYTPTTGYSLEFTHIVVNDGKYPLGDTANSIARHRYVYDIDQISGSDSTLLLTSVLSDSARLVIREIGLYARVKNTQDEGDGKEFLFGYIDNLNIDKGAEVPYDLILTVDLAISVVNVVGFPDANSFILNVMKPALLKNFVTARNVNTYVIENLERIIKMNSLQPYSPIGYCYSPETDEEVPVCVRPAQIPSIGYNTPQLVYKAQQAINEQENCYSAIQTYSKLHKKLKREEYTQFSPSSVLEEGDILISDNGLATGFSAANYLEPSKYLSEKDWTFYITFSLEETSTTNRCILSIGDLEGEYPDEETETGGIPFSYTPLVDIQVNRYRKIIINGGQPRDYTIEIGQKYTLKLIYEINSRSLQILDSDDTEIDILRNVPISSFGNIFLGTYGTYNIISDYEVERVISNPLTNGIIYLMECGFEQEGNNWVTTEEVVVQPAQLLQQYHLPALSLYSYKTYDICNNPEYYIEYLGDTYKGNGDLINFSNNLSLCAKINLSSLTSWANTKNEDYKPVLIIAKNNESNNELFSITITRTNSRSPQDNSTYLYDIIFTLQTTGAPIEVAIGNIAATDFENYIFKPFLLTIIRDENKVSLYMNNNLMNTDNNLTSDLPSYTNSYITNTKEGYTTGKYIKEIIVVKEAISTEQLYYITNLTDTNF